MKILGLVVILIFIHNCSAANRTTVWWLGSNQIYSSSGQFQACTTSGTATAASVNILSTSKLTVTGQYKAVIGLAATDVIANTALLTRVTIVFSYNTTHYLTLVVDSGSTLSVSAILLTSAIDPTLTTVNLVASPSTYPIVVENNRVISPTGSTWLQVSTIQDLYSASATQTTSSVLIVDYVSSSTIALVRYSGGTQTNSFLQIAIRTQTSTITGSNLLSSGCTITGRKRSVDHLIDKRALSSCPTSSIDPSLSSGTLTSICTNANTLYRAAASTTTQTDTNLVDATIRGVNAINALYNADAAVSKSSSKFSTGINFGVIIAISSFMFSHLY